MPTLSCRSGSEESQFQLSFVRHHLRRERGVECDVDARILNFPEMPDALLDLAGKESGSRAVGRRQRHGNHDGPVGIDVNAVDKAEVIHIDWDLRIVDGSDGLHNSRFKLFVTDVFAWHGVSGRGLVLSRIGGR